MNLKWKNQQFINYGNRIATNTLKYVGERLVKCSNQKFNSITQSMRSSYKTGGRSQKQEIIQKSFNQIDLNVIIVVIILTNNNTVQVMNEKVIKQSIRMYLGKLFDKENSAMRQFKEKLSNSKIKKINDKCA